MPDEDYYVDKVQTKVKHDFLRHYVERYAHKIGYAWPSLTYIDCFSGPWKSQADDFSDTSFFIASNELLEARKHYLEVLDKELRIRMFFLEKRPKSFRLLKEFSSGLPPHVDVETRNAELENSIDEIIAFIKKDADTFPFIFIDPTGWTGFGMDIITPLLELKPVEVLIMYMSEHIRRFIESGDQKLKNSFISLYGSIEALNRVTALSDRDFVDTDDKATHVYCDVLAERGNFQYVSRAMVFHGDKDKKYFNLIYATRDLHGLEAFKYAESKSMQAMEDERSTIQKRKSVDTDQCELFELSEVGPSETNFYVDQRSHYQKKARQEVLRILQGGEPVSYDEIWSRALLHPLTWEKDLKGWLRQWKADEKIKYTGLGDGRKVPKRGQGDHVEWISDSQE